MSYSRIAGTGSYLPEKILTNADLEKLVDTSDSWIVERTGIRERRLVTEHDTTASMATIAAERAITAAGIDKSQIDLVIVATSTPDKFIPSTACLVQEKLGLGECTAFDVSAACAGFNYILGIADQFIRTGNVRYALIIGSESMSRMLDWSDRNTCVLFGDGAGAMVLEASQQPGVLSSHLHAAGQYNELLYTPSGLRVDEKAHMKMSGSEVFKVAVTKLGEVLEKTLAVNHLSHEALDWLIPHQANLRIIQAMAKRLKMSLEKVVITLDKYGNTSAASVPISLDEAIRDGRIQRGQMIMLESFGGGFTWGAALIKY